MTDPFRSELEAAHQRIEKLEAEHAERVAKLEAENARLRQRLIDSSSRQSQTGRTFAALGIIILGVSLVLGIAFARVARVVTVPGPSEPPTELPPQVSAEKFNRVAAESAMDAVKLDGCSTGPARGHLRIVLSPDGTVTSALVDDGPTKDTSVAHCVEDRYRAVHVPPFSGAPVTVGRSFAIP